MRSLIHPHGLSLFIGANSQDQSTVAFTALMDALVHGANVVALVDSTADGGTFRARVSDWLKAHEADPAHLDRAFVLTNYRSLHDAEKLAKAITDQAGEKHVIVWADLARSMAALPPNDPRLPWLARIAQHFVVATVVTGAYGPDGVPPPRYSEYEADRVYLVQHASTSGVKIKVIPVTPQGERMLFRAKTGWGNVTMLVNEETEYAG